MDEPKYENEFIPTQAGTFVAYQPEFKTKETDIWIPVPIRKHPLQVIPLPKQFGGIMSTICLYGYAQANALMWWWAAVAEAEGKEIEVRLTEYEVNYDIKAKRA